MTYHSSKLEENREESESLVHQVQISHIRIKMRHRWQKIVYLRHLSLMLWTRAHCWKRKEDVREQTKKAHRARAREAHMQLTSIESPLLPL